MSEIEILQQSFMDSMNSMQKSFDKEKKQLQEKIDKLEKEKEEMVKEKGVFEDMFKEELKKKSNEINDLKKKNKELSTNLTKNEETKKKTEEEFERLNLQISEEKKKNTELLAQNEGKCKILKEEIDQLNLRIGEEQKKNKELSSKVGNNPQNEEIIKKLKEEIDELKEYKYKVRELNEQVTVLKNQFYLEEKLKTQFKEEKEKIEKTLEEKESSLNKLNEDIKKFEKQNKELLEYVKKAKDDEDKIKIEREKMKKEKEKFEKYKIEEEKRKKEDDKKRKEEEAKIKGEKEKKSTEMSEEKKNKFLIDILCEFLLKLNNSQYFLTVFDLLNKCLKNFEELNYFAKMSIKYNRPINDLLFNFYSNLRSYILLTGKNSALNNFLAQKTFKYSEIDKDDIETLKKIRNVKIGDNNNILDIYKKKKDLFFQKVGLTFDLLKDKILNDEAEDKNNDYPEVLKINIPPTQLDINFDKMDIIKLSPFISFQINNAFSKLEDLSIETSKVSLDIFYSLIFNCKNLKSISIILNDKLSVNNVEILNNMISIIFTYLKNITSFSYNNVPLLNRFLSGSVTCIKNSKLKKLSLISFFNSKEDISMFNSYFSGPNDLEEINFSNHSFNIPVLLANSLLNYEVSKKLTSINFNSCALQDEDFVVICKYISENNLLKYCNLGNNEISQKSCFNLGTMVEKTTSLETLILNNCKLNGETSMLLFNSRGAKTLKNININDNEIGDIGLVGLTAFIKNSPKIEIFELAGVGGNDMGFSTLINCVKISGNIKEIHFEKNKITKTSVDMIKGFNEDFKNKGVKFFINKFEGENDLDSLKFI